MYNQFFTIKPRISGKKRRKQSCTPNINLFFLFVCQFSLHIIKFQTEQTQDGKYMKLFISAVFSANTNEKRELAKTDSPFYQSARQGIFLLNINEEDSKIKNLK